MSAKSNIAFPTIPNNGRPASPLVPIHPALGPRRASSSTRRTMSQSLANVDDPVALKNEIAALRNELRHTKAHASSMEQKLAKQKVSAPFGSSSQTIGSNAALAAPNSRPSPPSPGLLPSSGPPYNRSPSPSARHPTNGSLSASTSSANGIAPPSPSQTSDLPARTPPASPQRSSSPVQSRIPISAVSHGRVLVTGDSPSQSSADLSSAGFHADTDTLPSDISSPTFESTDATSEEVLSPGGSSRDRESKRDRDLGGNPFFGSGSGVSARDRIAASRAANSSGGTGRVITNLQSDLMSARAALESVKSQLRLSQRAVEHLTRQTEDLKDGRERLRLENEGLSKMVTRKERMLEETLERARKAEGQLTAAVEGRKKEVGELKTRLKDVEGEIDEARLVRKKCESEYEAMKGSVSGIKAGWQREAGELRAELDKLRATYGKELEESRLKHQTLAKLFQSRQSDSTALTKAIEQQRSEREQFGKKYSSELAEVSKLVSSSTQGHDENLRRVEEVQSELNRIIRLMRASAAST